MMTFSFSSGTSEWEESSSDEEGGEDAGRKRKTAVSKPHMKGAKMERTWRWASIRKMSLLKVMYSCLPGAMYLVV